MIWLVILPVGLIVSLLIVLLISFYFVKDKKELPKFVVFLIHLFEWVMKLCHFLLLLGICILIVIVFATGVVSFSIEPQYMYIYLVGSACAFSYFAPKISYFSIKWVTKINTSEYTGELIGKIKKNSERLDFRILTYGILLFFYMLRNYHKYTAYKYDSVLMSNIIEVSAEALLTFVIVDTMLTIYNEKKSKRQ